MSRPPGTTIIFSDFPEGSMIGLDLDFFYNNNAVKGLKNINSGIHVFHFAIDQSSIRIGFYISAQEGKILLIKYDSENEKLLIDDGVSHNSEENIEKLPELYQFMIPYEQPKPWKQISSNISNAQLEYILPKNKMIDSLLTSTDENNKLLDALNKSAKSRNLSQDPIINSIIDQSEEEIKYTPMNLTQSIRPNSTISEKTEDALDKSWFLQNLLTTQFNDNNKLFIGEFEVSFLNMILFANYSSVVQWLKILKIIFNTRNLVLEKTNLFIEILDVLIKQLKVFPIEYADEYIESQFWTENLSTFDFNMKDLGIHTVVRRVVDIKNQLKLKFNINVDDYENNEDYEPVIVD